MDTRHTAYCVAAAVLSLHFSNGLIRELVDATCGCGLARGARAYCVVNWCALRDLEVELVAYVRDLFPAVR